MLQHMYHRAMLGFTVLELLISLAIGGIISGLAMPSIGNYKDNFEFRTDLSRFAQLLQSSRASALNLNSFIAVCHLENGLCKSFNSPVTVFTDLNDNRQLDANETTIAIHHFKHNRLVWWNKTNRIRFAPTGRALNGSLHYCWLKSGTSRGFKIIIARTGRMRTNIKNSHCL